MKKSRFSEQQMVRILREADKSPVAQVAKKHGVSEQTIYLWRKRFGKLEAVDVKRLRQLEQENAKLKKLVAERDLEIEVMKEVTAKYAKWFSASSVCGPGGRTFESCWARQGLRRRPGRLRPGRALVGGLLLGTRFIRPLAGSGRNASALRRCNRREGACQAPRPAASGSRRS